MTDVAKSDPLAEVRGIVERLPASLSLQPAHRAPVAAAIRVFRFLADPGAEEALEAKLDEIRDALMDSGDHTAIGRRFARPILAHLAKIAMGGENG